MACRRSISWSSALQDLRSDRAEIQPAERRCRLSAAAFANLAFRRAQASARIRPLVVSGAYDRRAIMCSAVAAANARRTVTGDTWRVCLSAALKGTWRAAKAARLLGGWHEKDGVAQAGATSVSVRPPLAQAPVSMQSPLRSTDVPPAQSLLTRQQLCPRPWAAPAHQSDDTASSPWRSA